METELTEAEKVAADVEEAAEQQRAQEFTNEFVQQLVARGLTAWPEFIVPETNIKIAAGRVPGTLVKTADGYTVLPNERKR